MNASFAGRLLGWKQGKSGLVPNAADTSSSMSTRIAAATLDALGVARGVVSGVDDPATGRPLERAVAADLAASDAIASAARFTVHAEPRLVTDFVQYSHLQAVETLARQSRELRMTLGADYLIRPDVVMSIPGDDLERPFLHAVVSCKWTIRSDRVQNIRHEYNQLVKHRRGRLPHLVTVTAEPLPTRLAAIVRGTGEVDATYHIAFAAMSAGIQSLRVLGELTAEQSDAWDEAVAMGRLRPFTDLAPTLARW